MSDMLKIHMWRCIPQKTHELWLSPQHQATTANTLDLCPPALRQFVGP